MRTAQRRNDAAFTLMELMIVISIIGVLAAVAIPSFRNYQLTAKRAEAFGNLASLAKAQKSYYAEFSEFLAAAPEPGATTGQLPGTSKRNVGALTTAFSAVGSCSTANSRRWSAIRDSRRSYRETDAGAT